MTRNSPETKLGTSVKWYTALNPSPNRPAASGRSTFPSCPIRAMARKSDGANVASFHATSAGPCHAAIPGARSDFVPRVAHASSISRTSVAPASSAFCTSSETIPGPSAYASKMWRRRVVSASCCPNASAAPSLIRRPRASASTPSSSDEAASKDARRDRTPIASAVL